MKIILQDVCWIMITKTHCRLIAVHLSRQKELDPDPKEIQQIAFFGHLKNLNNNGNVTDAGNDQYMFVLTIKKNQRNKIKIFSRKCNGLIKDGKL